VARSCDQHITFSNALTIRATEGAAGLTTDELADMASEFQWATTFGDEFVLEVSRQHLSFRSITEEVFDDALAVILNFSPHIFPSDAIFGTTAMMKKIWSRATNPKTSWPAA
jgi:hypothetical protein